MKRLILILFASAVTLPAITQDDSTKLSSATKASTGSQTHDIKVSVGDDIISVEDTDESKRIRIGNRGIEILETLESPRVAFRKYENEEMDELSFLQDSDENQSSRRRSGRRFEGHWSGLEIGFNNFLTPDRSMVLPNDIYYLTLNSGRAKNVNLNFAQINIGVTRRIGFVTGLGFNMSNYVFEGNNSIIKGTNGIIEPLIPDAGITYEKSKLTTRYITAPFLLEIQIPAGYNNHLNVAAGPIGAIKIGSHTKTVFYSEGKQKVKDHSDFSLNMLRYGFTARVGYEMVQFYGTYYMTPLFKTDKGPELYPFEIGVSFTIND